MTEFNAMLYDIDAECSTICVTENFIMLNVYTVLLSELYYSDYSRVKNYISNSINKIY